MKDVVLPGPSRHLVAGAAPRYEAQARFALEHVRDVEAEQGLLDDGDVIQLYWWPLTVRLETGALRLVGPSPFCDPVEDLTAAFVLLAMQLSTAQRLGVEPFGFDPERIVHVAPGALESAKFMAKRLPEPAAGSTGWHLRPDGELKPYDDDYEELSVGQIFERRPIALAAFALPDGLLVRFEEDRIVSVLDQRGTERWPGA
jgi:hypothetical protein